MGLKVDPKGKMLMWRLDVLLFGLIAGLVSSLGISSIILLTEKLIGLPIGTFYIIITDALIHSSSISITNVIYGLTLHLITGALLGLVMAIPFSISKGTLQKLTKYSQLYGAGLGLGIWALFCVHISFMIVLPQISQISIIIVQHTPTGTRAGFDSNTIQAAMWKIIVLALPFNVFYGFVVGIIIKSFNEKYIPFLTSVDTLKNSLWPIR
jgi:tetrahydromethanopterin S-methyltransferase subunit B